ncbi:hypothetical protein [Psychromonas arctica]|uniref:hypothetical protein n=1 Tax=Psychromonas arctica TaxID=168275 RepID=UPI00048B473D|nr:hypothetical protein [Psychromonas arctica]
MNRSLRKGMTRLYLQHQHTGHSTGAKLCESEIENDLATLRFTLAPLDGNQKSDESYLHEEQLISASLNDDTIIRGFVAHVKQSAIKVTNYKLEVISKGQKLVFDVYPEITTQGNLSTLSLSVKNG